jgi:hypothetical protein
MGESIRNGVLNRTKENLTHNKKNIEPIKINEKIQCGTLSLNFHRFVFSHKFVVIVVFILITRDDTHL